jgi:protein TonB
MTRFRSLWVLLLSLPAAAGCREEPVAETPPRQVSPSPFHYPEELWDAGVSGQTTLRIFITAAGMVDSVGVERGSGHAAFDSAAVRGARELRFQPATRGGEPSGVWRLLPVQFHPDSAAASGAAAGHDPAP